MASGKSGSRDLTSLFNSVTHLPNMRGKKKAMKIGCCGGGGGYRVYLPAFFLLLTSCLLPQNADGLSWPAILVVTVNLGCVLLIHSCYIETHKPQCDGGRPCAQCKDLGCDCLYQDVGPSCNLTVEKRYQPACPGGNCL